MPKKESGMWRNKNAPMSKNSGRRASGPRRKVGPGGYSEGGKVKKRWGGAIHVPSRPESSPVKIEPPKPQRGYGQAVNGLPGRAGGGATEVGKKVQSYKEYVKKTFGGGKT